MDVRKVLEDRFEASVKDLPDIRIEPFVMSMSALALALRVCSSSKLRMVNLSSHTYCPWSMRDKEVMWLIFS